MVKNRLQDFKILRRFSSIGFWKNIKCHFGFWGCSRRFVCVRVSMQKVISSDSFRIRSRRRITWLRSNSKLKENLGVFLSSFSSIPSISREIAWKFPSSCRTRITESALLYVFSSSCVQNFENQISKFDFCPILDSSAASLPHVELKSFQIFSSSSSTLTWKPSYVQDPNCKGCEEIEKRFSC